MIDKLHTAMEASLTDAKSKLANIQIEKQKLNEKEKVQNERIAWVKEELNKLEKLMGDQ
jgi:predicted nuclease with TOPRIM domain